MAKTTKNANWGEFSPIYKKPDHIKFKRTNLKLKETQGEGFSYAGVSFKFRDKSRSSKNELSIGSPN